MLDFYKIHEVGNDTRIILEQAMKRLKQLAYGIIIFDCVVFNSGIVLLTTFLLTRAYVLLVPIYLPYLNEKELVGYLMNLVFQLALGAVGFFTFATYDATILICGYHSLTTAEILNFKMKKLQKNLQQPEVDETEKFISVIKFQQEVRKYNEEFSNLVQIPFVTAIILNLIGIGLCINLALKVSIVLGIGASLGLFIQLLIPFMVAVMQTAMVRIN